jgi:hypothetical protein
MRGAAAGLALALALFPGAAAASAECRQALLLALDVSASVDSREYRLQAEGLARALLAPEIRDAFLALPGAPVALAVFEWSGPVEQRPVLPWTPIEDAAALADAAASIAAHPRATFRSGRTAIGAAMSHAAALFAAGPDCALRTLDISGDGENNAPPAPQGVRDAPAMAGVTVNALAIGGDIPLDHEPWSDLGPGLSDYFRAEVIRGPGAFVEIADGYEDFEDAMRRKLLRELGGLAVSGGR